MRSLCAWSGRVPERGVRGERSVLAQARGNVLEWSFPDAAGAAWADALPFAALPDGARCRGAGTKRRGAFEMHHKVVGADRGDAAWRDVDIPRATKDRRPPTIEGKSSLDGVGPRSSRGGSRGDAAGRDVVIPRATERAA